MSMYTSSNCKCNNTEEDRGTHDSCMGELGGIMRQKLVRYNGEGVITDGCG